jgi:alpha-tubulin suppressor-like RCC1 family protein
LCVNLIDMKKTLLSLFVIASIAKQSTINAQTIAAGRNHSLSLCTDAKAMAVGYNGYGQLGDGTTTSKSTPVKITSLSGITAVAGGGNHSLFLKNDGTVWAVGYNAYGQLGDGTTTSKSTPVQILGLTGVVAIAAGWDYSFFLKNDGTVWAVGRNNYGQLGDGTSTNKYTPIQIGGLTGITAVAAGEDHSLFLKNDGTVWAVGRNNYGQLGDGTTVDTSTPVQVAGLSEITALAAGWYHSLFLKNDGTVWAVGYNGYGQLGDGTIWNKSSPVKITSLSGITAVAGGANHSLFLKNDGTVWAVGLNIYGQLGDGTTTSKSTPVKITSLSSITAVAGGGNHSLFLKNDGTVWAVGHNASGQLGDGTTTSKSTPVQTTGLCLVLGTKGIVGNIYNDINENCFQETEPGLNKRKAIIQPGNIIVETNSGGYWRLESLPASTYTVTIDTTGKWRPTCDVTQSFTVTDPDGFTFAPSFGMISTEPCSEPTVSINIPFMRPGFSGQKAYVQACNDYIATGALADGYVDVALDELITVDAASMGYTALGDNTFRFDVGTLNPGQCVSFDMSTTLSVSAVLGQTLCMEALLFPVENCVLDTLPTPTPPDFTPCTLPWDKSSILVEGACVDGEIIFTITNTGDPGDGDMDCFSPVRLYIDGEYIWLDSLKLNGGETFTYTFAGDGRTWRLEVDQHPLHPGHSRPNATIERCGNPSNWTPNLVNILPHDDEDPIKDIYCGIVTGSYDPNDKTGYPLGVGEDHLIEPNRKMDYVIRFQNTGTDTAFTVKILDTLDTDLDIFSVRSGVSSHSYSFRMYGPRVLEWTFYNIKLPDSTTNEPESNGFVTFTVNQVKNLPDGTEINNQVGIYFDFNDPIITNTTSHIIGRSIKTPPPLSVKDVSATLNMTRLYPNPNNGSFTLAFGTQLTNATIHVKDLLGKTVYSTQANGDKLNIQLNEAKGIYFVSIQTEQGERATLKLVVE